MPPSLKSVINTVFEVGIMAKKIASLRKTIITFAGWDWKHQANKDDLKGAMAKFGIFVYDNPLYYGSDAIGLIFSNKALTTDELFEAANKEYDQ